MSSQTPTLIRPVAPSQGSVARPSRASIGVRAFHSAASFVLLLLVFWGFHHFYTEGRAYPGRELAPPMRTVLIVHGVSMTAWLLLSVVQPLLALLRNMRVHRTLGMIGTGLAVAIAVPGLLVAIASVQNSPPGMVIWGLTPHEFMIVPVASLVVFLAFVTAGIWARKRPAVHRPMMQLATLAVASAGISRIDALSNLYAGTVWDHLFGPFFFTLVFGGLLLLGRCLVTRSFDRWFAGGYAALVLANFAMMRLATTGVWSGIAHALA